MAIDNLMIGAKSGPAGRVVGCRPAGSLALADNLVAKGLGCWPCLAKKAGQLVVPRGECSSSSSSFSASWGIKFSFLFSSASR